MKPPAELNTDWLCRPVASLQFYQRPPSQAMELCPEVRSPGSGFSGGGTIPTLPSRVFRLDLAYLRRFNAGLHGVHLVSISIGHEADLSEPERQKKSRAAIYQPTVFIVRKCQEVDLVALPGIELEPGCGREAESFD